MEKTVTVNTLLKMKREAKKIVMLTAYDFPFAKILDETGVDIVLVGDSLGMVVQGGKTTLSVTMDEMIYHTRMVAKATQRAMVVGDMPFMSYQVSVQDAIYNAGRFLKEAGAAMVKLEGGATVCNTIEAISRADIPVMAHIGLTPQSVHKMGGYRIQREEERLLEDAKRVASAGASAVVLECIPSSIAQKITESVEIPTIGIGAGVHCDGQVLVLHDLLGLYDRRVPRFVKRYADLGRMAREAILRYGEEVRGGIFPSSEQSF